MWILHCCLLGAANEHDAEAAGSATAGRPVAPIPCATAADSAIGQLTSACSIVTSGPTSPHNQRGVNDTCKASSGVATVTVASSGVATVTVDVKTPVEGQYGPARWSDWTHGRPELEHFLPSPFVSGNCSSSSRILQMPESFNLDSTALFGGLSGGVGAVRQPPGRDLRKATIGQLLSVVTSASWVGQGAQGAVVKGQWRSGCTVTVKWLVTSAVNFPAAYLEALLAKMLAHPFLVQTFDCAICQLDDTFDQVAGARVLCGEALASSPAGSAMRTAAVSDWHGLADPVSPKTQTVAEHLSVVAAQQDSFDGNSVPAGSRPVDCVGVLRQLGASAGKYVVQIVSEWCDEGNLHAAIRRGVFRPQPPGPGCPGRSRTWAMRALLRTAREIAQGMCYLHSLNIIHGDLKPGNVLLKSSRIDSRGFVAKVADFGLSRLCNQREEYVATADWGTVPYMAGEYLDNRLCKSSDVYSFGVLLWQMYTGRAPFEGHLEAQVAVGVMMGDLQLEWPQNTPAPLSRLGQACCRHQHEQRPTFKEVVAALTGIESQVRALALNAKAQRAAAAAATAASTPPLLPSALQRAQPSAASCHLAQPQPPPQHQQSLRRGKATAAAAAAYTAAQQQYCQDCENQPQPQRVGLDGDAGGGGGLCLDEAPAATATAAAASPPPSFLASLRSSSLERPGGGGGGELGAQGAAIASPLQSCILSGCSFLPIGGGGAVGGGGAAGDDGAVGGSTFIYPADSLSSTAQFSMSCSISYSSQVQQQCGNPQTPRPLPPPMHCLGAASLSAADHALRLAALPDGPIDPGPPGAAATAGLPPSQLLTNHTAVLDTWSPFMLHRPISTDVPAAAMASAAPKEAMCGAGVSASLQLPPSTLSMAGVAAAAAIGESWRAVVGYSNAGGGGGIATAAATRAAAVGGGDVVTTTTTTTATNLFSSSCALPNTPSATSASAGTWMSLAAAPSSMIMATSNTRRTAADPSTVSHSISTCFGPVASLQGHRDGEFALVAAAAAAGRAVGGGGGGGGGSVGGLSSEGSSLAAQGQPRLLSSVGSSATPGHTGPRRGHAGGSCGGDAAAGPLSDSYDGHLGYRGPPPSPGPASCRSNGGSAPDGAGGGCLARSGSAGGASCAWAPGCLAVARDGRGPDATVAAPLSAAAAAAALMSRTQAMYGVGRCEAVSSVYRWAPSSGALSGCAGGGDVSGGAGGAGAGAGGIGSPGMRSHVRAPPPALGMPPSPTAAVAAPLALPLRAMSGRRGSTGPALQLVPEDDDDRAPAAPSPSPTASGAPAAGAPHAVGPHPPPPSPPQLAPAQ